MVLTAKLAQRIGTLVEATGSEGFYGAVANFLAEMINSNRWVVMRYKRYAVPEFVENNSVTDELKRIYLDGLYRFDPLLRLVDSGIRDDTFILSKLRKPKSTDVYLDQIYQSSLIRDEAGILLSVPGGGCMAICIDHGFRNFRDTEIKIIENVFPLVKSIHTVHLDRTFLSLSYGSGRGSNSRAKQAIIIFDRHHQPIFRNEDWFILEKKKQIPDFDQIDLNSGNGTVALEEGNVLYWERLDDKFAVAPGGLICTIEQRSPGYLTVNIKESLRDFQHRHKLTSRECEIIDLVLQGYPNSMIAKKLDIAAGSVRNHRHRLYNKLDITTERELFFMFIDFLLGSPE